MNQYIHKITAACAAAAALCYFLPFALFYIQFVGGVSNSFLSSIPEAAVIGTLLSSFGFLAVVVVGLHFMYFGGSWSLRLVPAIGVYGCLASLSGSLLDWFSALVYWDEAMTASGYVCVGIWLLAVNVQARRHRLWPSPVAFLGFMASVPMLLVVLMLFTSIDFLYPWLIGLLPMWLAALSAILILKDIQRAPE